MPKEAFFLAGKAFLNCRKHNGEKNSPLLLQGVHLCDCNFAHLDQLVPHVFITAVACSDLDVVTVSENVDAAGCNERFVSYSLGIGSHTFEIIFQALVDRSGRDGLRGHECVLGQPDLQKFRGSGIDRVIKAEFLADYLVVGFFRRLDVCRG